MAVRYVANNVKRTIAKFIQVLAIEKMLSVAVISCKNTFGAKKVWPSKVESYLEVNT